MNSFAQTPLARTVGVQTLIDLLKTEHWDFEYDPYGSVTAALFDLADSFYEYSAECLPDYRPGCGLEQGDGMALSETADSVRSLLFTGAVSEEDVRTVYGLLSRCQDILRAQGRDY